ncbi:MAG: hypothetical protein NWF06_10355 [Candidatus Bathyarchaeota archaeon]|nr:hypothetical protein [Candidatus Bathyarchaeum sp.]
MEVTRTQIIAVFAVAVIVVGVVFAWHFAGQYSIYSYSKSVPIESMSYNEVTEYWLLGTTVDETEAFKLVLEEDTVEGDVVTQSDVSVLFNPLNPTSTTSMDVYDIEWRDLPASAFYVDQHEALPAFEVSVDNWLTSARYEVGVYKNDVQLAYESVEVNYKTSKIISLATPEGDVQVENLGYLPNGVNPPSSDLVVVVDPNGNERFYQKADVILWINQWNDLIYWDIFKGYSYTYEEFWERSITEGYLPNEITFQHVSDVSFNDDMSYVTLTYSGIAFAGSVVVRVPSDLADTIIVQQYDPNPVITSVSPSPLPSIKEGEHVNFDVVVRNDGSQGTVSVTCTSGSYSLVPLTSTSFSMEAGETKTVRFMAYALNVMSDKDTTVSILAQGRGGTDTFDLAGHIESVEGYTPDIPDDVDPDGGDGGSEEDWVLWLTVGCVVSVIVVAVVAYAYRRMD